MSFGVTRITADVIRYRVFRRLYDQQKFASEKMTMQYFFCHSDIQPNPHVRQEKERQAKAERPRTFPGGEAFPPTFELVFRQQIKVQ